MRSGDDRRRRSARAVLGAKLSIADFAEVTGTPVADRPTDPLAVAAAAAGVAPAVMRWGSSSPAGCGGFELVAYPFSDPAVIRTHDDVREAGIGQESFDLGSCESPFDRG